MTDAKPAEDAQLWTLSILRQCVDEDPRTPEGVEVIDELIADVHDRYPEGSLHLTAALVSVSFTLLTELSALTGQTAHGLIDQLALAYHPDFDQPKETS